MSLAVIEVRVRHKKILHSSLPIRYCIFYCIIQLPSNPLIVLSNVSLTNPVLQLYTANSKVLNLGKNAYEKAIKGNSADVLLRGYMYGSECHSAKIFENLHESQMLQL